MKDWEKEFFAARLELDYGDCNAAEKIKNISRQVPWLEGWPEDRTAFWNGEAFMWQQKIDPKKRAAIAGELHFLEGGKNLDLGCGSYSYIPSVGFDISEKMLLLNENCIERIAGDLEKKLPFADGDFDSVTLIFVLDYVRNCLDLLKEIRRVLKKEGSLVVVQSLAEVNSWQRQKKVNHFTGEGWNSLFLEQGFEVEVHQKEKLVFFNCKGSKVY